MVVQIHERQLLKGRRGDCLTPTRSQRSTTQRPQRRAGLDAAPVCKVSRRQSLEGVASRTTVRIDLCDEAELLRRIARGRKGVLGLYFNGKIQVAPNLAE